MNFYKIDDTYFESRINIRVENRKGAHHADKNTHSMTKNSPSN